MSDFTETYPEVPDPDQLMKTVRDQELERRKDLVQLLEQPAGRRVFSWLLLETCGLLNSGYPGENATSFTEGRRHVGLQILSALAQACPEVAGHLLQPQDDPQPDSDR